MLRRITMGLVGGALAGNCLADLTHSAVSISSPFGELDQAPLVGIINQSGLSSTYESGVTDIESFASSSTHYPFLGTSHGLTGQSTDGPQHFTFDLGQEVPLSSIAIWNTYSAGAITSFELYADNDDDLYNGTQELLMGPTPLVLLHGTDIEPIEAELFSFETTMTRYMHLNGLTTLNPPDFYTLAEVVFGVVPSPGSGLVVGLFMARLCGTRRRS